MAPRVDYRALVRNVRDMIGDIDGSGTSTGLPSSDVCLDVRCMEGLMALWRHRQNRDVVLELFDALRQRQRIYGLVLEPKIFHPEDAANELSLYDCLGSALAGVASIIEIKLQLQWSPGAAQAVAHVLRHLQNCDCEALVWSILPGSDGSEDDFDVVRSALTDQASIDHLWVSFASDERPSEADSETLGNLFAVSSSLPSLKVLYLHGGVDDSNVALLRPLLHVPNLHYVEFAGQHFLSYEGAATLCAAIADSPIHQMAVEDCDSLTLDATIPSPATRTFGMVPPLAMALRAPRLGFLFLKRLTFRSQRSCVAFAGALSSCRLGSLSLVGMEWHEGALTDIARAVCLPTLTELELDWNDDFTAEVGKFLKQCQMLDHIHAASCMMDCDVLEEFLAGCARSRGLGSLVLPCCSAWSAGLEEAMAKCISELPKLKYISIQVDSDTNEAAGNGAGATFSAPVLLAACRSHPSLESLSAKYEKNYRSLWCPEFDGELTRVLEKNTETCAFRRRLNSPSGAAVPPGLVARALSKKQAKPHLLYLGVTYWVCHLV